MSTTITGSLKTLATTAQAKAFVRFTLRGTGGTQPRFISTAVIAPSGAGAEWHWDFSADASGNISGTLYSTRDATGTGDGEIDCGGVKTAVWYGMTVWVNGKPGPEVPLHAKNGIALDITAVTPISVPPVATAPTGDTTYARLDGGNQPFTGPLTTVGITDSGTSVFKNSNNRLFADQFSGSDMGAKIAAAIAAAPSTGCIIDATAFQGAQAAAVTITVNKPVQILLGNVTLTLAGSPAITLTSSGASIVGLGMQTTVLITSSGTADILNIGATFCQLEGFSMRTSVARTGGSAINLAASSGNGSFRHLRLDKTFNGIKCVSNSGTGNCAFANIQMGSGLSSFGSWNSGILLGQVASGTVAEFHFADVRITGDSAFADAMVNLYDGCDTILFSNCAFVQSGTDSVCLKTDTGSGGASPEWLRFVNCIFEGGPTKNGITINQARNVEFHNCQATTSKQGMAIAAGIGVTWIGGNIINNQNEGIAVNGGSGFSIYGAQIGDNGLATNNTYDDINIAAGVSDWIVLGCTYQDVLGTSPANKPKYNLEVAAGASGNFTVAFNDFKLAGATGTFLNGGNTGNWTIIGNIPTTIANDIRQATNFFGGSCSFSSRLDLNGTPNSLSLAGVIPTYRGIATEGNGVPAIFKITSQKSESAADTNVLTYTPPAVAGTYRLTFNLALSAANTATLGWTATWKDSNGIAKSPANISLMQVGTAAPALTFATSATDEFYGCATIDIDNSATNIVIKLTFTGTSFTGKASASIERLI